MREIKKEVMKNKVLFIINMIAIAISVTSIVITGIRYPYIGLALIASLIASAYINHYNSKKVQKQARKKTKSKTK